MHLYHSNQLAESRQGISITRLSLQTCSVIAHSLGDVLTYSLSYLYYQYIYANEFIISYGL